MEKVIYLGGLITAIVSTIISGGFGVFFANVTVRITVIASAFFVGGVTGDFVIG